MSAKPACLCAALIGPLICQAVHAAELPKSPACRMALQALEQAEDALADAKSTPSLTSAPDVQRQHLVTAKLRPLRQRVADACLGGMTSSPPPSQHTLIVPSTPRVAPAAPPARLATPQVGSEPLLRWQPPVTVTNCSGATCTASDGSTLTRVGQTLVGPRGACTLQGSFLNCP
ncbi:hypothetical protein ACG04R_05205 [Roseateles sp. BYS78W]|uniref:Uncharacterized protein n=1 Tax=Pelomonas candidula TaxID=3299025 RepID=A0ABW7H814_9BURK